MKNRLKMGIIPQIYILVGLCVCMIGLFTYYSQVNISRRSEKKDLVTKAVEVAAETAEVVKEYPAFRWLLGYWYENRDSLEIEYDVNFYGESQTRDKWYLFHDRHPDKAVRYLTDEEAAALPPEDQKLFAEITYSWLITRINEIKINYKVAFLYCVVSDTDAGENPYADQVFLFSAAAPGAVRGSGADETFPLGVVVDTAQNESIKKEMIEAVEYARTGEESVIKDELDESGGYMDKYFFLDWLGEKAVLIGISFDTRQVIAEISEQAWEGTRNAMIYLFLLAQIILIHLFAFVIRPLRKVTQNIRLYMEKKNSEEVRNNLSRVLSGPISLVIRHNEIGQLADDFNDLTVEMDEYVDRIETAAPDEVISRMTKRLAEYVGETEQFDDITMLSFRYRRRERRGEDTVS